MKHLCHTCRVLDIVAPAWPEPAEVAKAHRAHLFRMGAHPASLDQPGRRAA